MVDRTAEAFGMQPATSRGRNLPRRRNATEEPKGIGYAELLLDNIIGLDNQYESTGEAFGKSFNEDELGTLKNMAVSAYEGAKEFVTSPIETTGNIVNDIRDSVYRLGSEDLDARIRRMYGIGYQDATDEQVTKAREAVIGDAVTASSLIPAAKGIKSVATAARTRASIPNSLPTQELLDYNASVRKPLGLLDRDRVLSNDNILYRPDRVYRFIGRGGYEDFVNSGLIRAKQGTKQDYGTPYFMKGKSSSRYGEGKSGEFLVETIPSKEKWTGAAESYEKDKYVGPKSALTKDDLIRIFKRQEDGSYEIVYDNIGDAGLIPKQGYAEGGTVMPNTETQMNRLMQEGGIADDGMRRDPVSGNEIPPGSMATEVRDDIPAQLSEGEYIVPADVLRYYGVAFFEQLRAKAKRGLAEMEAGGRIGGEPVEMEDEDELPFDISELETAGDDTDMQMAAMGMAKGGVVKMQQGGVATDATATKTFDPTMYQTPGGTLFNTSAGAQQQQKVEYRVYQNAQGQTMSILFINGVAQQPIPEGFFPQGEGPKVEEPTPTDRGDRDETPQPPQKSFNEYTVEDWISYKPDTGVGSTLGQIAGGIIGGALLGPAGALLGAKGMQESMARNSISAYNSLNEYVGAMNKSDPNYSALADKRNKMYGDLTAAQEENPGFFSNIINSVFGKPTINPPKTGAAAAARAATTAAPATSRDDDKAPAAATGGGAAAAPAGTTTLGGKTVSVGYGAGQVDPGLAKAAAAAEKSKATSAATAQSYGASVDKTSKKAEDVSVLAKGGLMQKPKPKKPTQKRKIKTVST